MAIVVASCSAQRAEPASSSAVLVDPGGTSVTTDASATDDGGSPDPVDDAVAPPAEGDTSAEAGAPTGQLDDTAPVLACDGLTVICVDSAAVEGGIGNAEGPLISIREAIAVAGPGSTIQVAAGVYAEPIILDASSDLALVGGFPGGGDFSVRDPAVHETVLQGDGDSSVVSITRSTGIHVEGFVITGGGGSTDQYSWFGGGVHVDEASSDVTIAANHITANAVDAGDDPGSNVGGGIASFGTGVSIVGNRIDANRAGRGAGIAALGASTTIEGNVVDGNVSVGDHGGGIYALGEVRISGNRVTANEVGVDLGYGWGGGIIVFGDDTAAVLEGNVVTGNTSPTAGAGVFVDDGADAELVDELYHGNVCTSDGGTALLVDSGGQTPTVALLRNVTIADTACPDSGNAGALLAAVSDEGAPPCQVTIADSVLWGNGGADVLAVGCALTVSGSVVEQVLEPAVDGGDNVSADPGFSDPAAGDFATDPTGPAAGRGARTTST